MSKLVLIKKTWRREARSKKIMWAKFDEKSRSKVPCFTDVLELGM